MQEQTVKYSHSIWQGYRPGARLCLALQQENQTKSAPWAPHFTPKSLPSHHPRVTKSTCGSGNSQAPFTPFGQPAQG